MCIRDSTVTKDYQVLMTPKRSITQVATPSPEDFAGLPGCAEAYWGLAKLPLALCSVSGSKIIIPEATCAQFNGAPASVRAEIEKLKNHHTNAFENLLVDMMVVSEDDPRIDPDAPEEEEDTPDLVFESEEELKRQVQIKSEAKAQWLHSVRMLRDDEDNVYLLATADTVTLPK